jgi:hypothetical protein
VKTYLYISPTPTKVSAQGYLETVQQAIEWVESPSDATADYLEAVQATQQKLKAQGIETTLEEIPNPRQMVPKYVISRYEPITKELAEMLNGKTPDEMTAILHSKGFHVARQRADGNLSYPIFIGTDGNPAFNTGNSVPKALLIIHEDAVEMKFFPENEKPTQS